MKKKRTPSLVLATRNKHKISEIRAVLRNSGLNVRLYGLDRFPKKPPTVENQPTLQGNAIKKATETAAFTGQFALADDTGLFVRTLGGQPGVYSARFAGPRCDYAQNCRKLLKKLKGRPLRERRAFFETVAALVTPGQKVYLARGKVSGWISLEPHGHHGFGYDPVFYVPKFKQCFAEMNSTLKNKISHRAKAFEKIPSLLKKALKEASHAQRP